MRLYIFSIHCFDLILIQRRIDGVRGRHEEVRDNVVRRVRQPPGRARREADLAPVLRGPAPRRAGELAERELRFGTGIPGLEMSNPVEVEATNDCQLMFLEVLSCCTNVFAKQLFSSVSPLLFLFSFVKQC